MTETTPKINCAFISVKQREIKYSELYFLNVPGTVYGNVFKPRNRTINARGRRIEKLNKHEMCVETEVRPKLSSL
jgi:hypothetical protein